MRTWVPLLALGLVQADPARILSDRFGFSASDVHHAANGQPVVKMLTTDTREELAIVGAIPRTPSGKADLGAIQRFFSEPAAQRDHAR